MDIPVRGGGRGIHAHRHNPNRQVLQRIAASETDAADGLMPSSACAAPDGAPLRVSVKLRVSIPVANVPHPSTNPAPPSATHPSQPLLSAAYELHRRNKAQLRPRVPSSPHAAPFSGVLVYFLDKNMSEEGWWWWRMW